MPILADTEKRARYDRFGHAGVGSAAGQGFGGFDATVFNDFQDIFGDLFGFGDMFGGQGGRRSRAQRGADLREDLTLEFEEAVFGVTKQVRGAPPGRVRASARAAASRPASRPSTAPLAAAAGRCAISRAFSPSLAPAPPAAERASSSSIPARNAAARDASPAIARSR